MQLFSIFAGVNSNISSVPQQGISLNRAQPLFSKHNATDYMNETGTQL